MVLMMKNMEEIEGVEVLDLIIYSFNPSSESDVFERGDTMNQIDYNL
jgi:hypothetical protein